LHCALAAWQRPQLGRCSSHFWRRALQRLQPVKERDMVNKLNVLMVVLRKNYIIAGNGKTTKPHGKRPECGEQQARR
jgi:hypothetical protein